MIKIFFYKLLILSLILLIFFIFRNHDHVLFLLIIFISFYFLFINFKEKIFFKIINVFLITFFLLEITIILNPIKSEFIKSITTNLILSRENNFYILNKDLGYNLKPNTSNTDVKVNFYTRAVEYNGNYNINSLGNRNSGYDNVDYNTIFMGCSFTFGEGLDDHETLAYKVNKFKKVNAINTGVGGYGFEQAKIKTEKFINKNTKNIIYFALPSSHAGRDAGFIKQLKEKRITNMKAYNKEELNNPIIKKLRGLIYYFVKFDTVKLFNGVKYSVNDSFKNKNEIRKNYINNLKKFDEKMEKNKINFIILVYDYDDENKVMVNNIKKELNAKILIVSEILNLKSEKDFKEQYAFILDGHPNNKFNELISEYLKDLLI